MNRDGYRDQIVTHDVGVSLHSKTHPCTVHEVEQWHKHTVLCISLSELVSCAFSTIPICPFFNSKNFSFTCYSTLCIYIKKEKELQYKQHHVPRDRRFQTHGSQFTNLTAQNIAHDK